MRKPSKPPDLLSAASALANPLCGCSECDNLSLNLLPVYAFTSSEVAVYASFRISNPQTRPGNPDLGTKSLSDPGIADKA